MMRVTVKGSHYEIKFRHVIHKGGAWYRGHTDCSVSEGMTNIDGKFIGVGLVVLANTYCSAKDNFCRATGRKISLGRALLKAFPDKEDRRFIWQQYFKKMGVVHQ